MYLEMAGRQSGKTYRLMKDLIYHHYLNKLCKFIIIQPDYEMTRYCKMKFNDVFKDDLLRNCMFIYSSKTLQENLIPINFILKNSQYRIYVDQYLLCNYAKQFLMENLQDERFNKNSYLTSSMSNKLDDNNFLNDLKQLNDKNILEIFRI